MIVIPAVDLRGGRCVRLYQGDPGRETVFADDPVAVARRWVAAGAER
ncbi:MAG TPA: HisA/HisF-related TIM barrel protein, partial [Candidatus Binatia bacterium]|nr:HisA/HisF-related TIM barrel protein [Candidatus Binatia bacterium]